MEEFLWKHDDSFCKNAIWFVNRLYPGFRAKGKEFMKELEEYKNESDDNLFGWLQSFYYEPSPAIMSFLVLKAAMN